MEIRNKETILVKNLQETQITAKALASKLKKGDIICLNGDLGAGKTTFSKFVIAFLGINELVSSPTFTIINEYMGRFPVYHFDVYRINDIEEMFELGYEEYFFGDGICLIEWAENIKELIPKESIFVTMEYGSHEEERRITISYPANENKIKEE